MGLQWAMLKVLQWAKLMVYTLVQSLARRMGRRLARPKGPRTELMTAQLLVRGWDLLLALW
jgi:hypothetical protein